MSLEGIGGNLCCVGDVICAPYALKQWSKQRTAGTGRNIEVYVKVNNTP